MTASIAMVTGTGSAAGHAACRLLANSCQRIVAVSASSADLRTLRDELQVQVELLALEADLATLEGRARCLEALRQLGPFDILVNAPVPVACGPLATACPETDQALMRRLLDAPVELCRAAVPLMMAQGCGTLVNVLPESRPADGSALYTACVAFLSTFTEGLEAELAGSDLRVHCVEAARISAELPPLCRSQVTTD